MDISSYTYKLPESSQDKREMQKLVKKINAKLEEKVMRMATTIDQLIKAASVRSSEHKEEMAKLAKKNADLEKRFITMATAVGNLKKPPPPLPHVTTTKDKNSGNLVERNAALEKRVLEMASTINQLKTASNAHLSNKEDIGKLGRKNVELEKKVKKLSSTIDQLNATSPVLNATKSKACMLPQRQPLGPYMDELVRCFYVLVFLVCVLIGVRV